ncbi:MAG: hypothetical protein E6R04_02070 [Spirochaetes bacterium]|nr:MAG: hypothetical protein E6R04_02070 [Spirochaetota bacterium]
MNKAVLRLAREFYFRRLTEMNPYFIATPAKLEILNRQVEAIRQEMARKETNPVWKVPVRIEPDGTSVTRFDIVFVGE